MHVWQQVQRRLGGSGIHPVFLPFCRFWRLSDEQARRFWSALVQATSPQSCAWRQHLLLFEATHLGSSVHLMEVVSTPAVVVEVLEALIVERRIPPGVARGIEQRILDRTDRDGRWKGTAIPLTKR